MFILEPLTTFTMIKILALIGRKKEIKQQVKGNCILLTSDDLQ